MKTKPMLCTALSFFNKESKQTRSAMEPKSVKQESYIYHLNYFYNLFSQKKLQYKKHHHAQYHQQYITTYLAALQQPQLPAAIIHQPYLPHSQFRQSPIFQYTLLKNAAKLCQWLYNDLIIQFIHIPFILQHFSKACCFF